jgi:hypothetical protein
VAFGPHGARAGASRPRATRGEVQVEDPPVEEEQDQTQGVSRDL